MRKDKIEKHAQALAAVGPATEEDRLFLNELVGATVLHAHRVFKNAVSQDASFRDTVREYLQMMFADYPPATRH